MPKQQFKIEQFHGGLNTDSDPRDISENEFSSLKGLSVSSLGRVCLLGSGVIAVGGSYLTAILDVASATNSINEGYGLFTFSSDYDDAGALVSTDYVALYDVANGYLSIYDGADAVTAWNNVSQGEGDPANRPDSDDGIPTALDSDTTAPTSTSNGTPNFYAPNGNLRICDGTFSNVNRVPKWYGVPSKKILAPNEIEGYGDDEVGGTWHTANAGIEETTYRNVEPGNFERAPRANLVASNTSTDVGTVGGADRTFGHFNASNPYIFANWGTHLNFVEASDNSGTWQPDTGTTYRFYGTFVYDGIQESQPKTFMMHPNQTDSSNDGLTTVDELQFWNTATDAAQTNTAHANFANNIGLYMNINCRWHGDHTVNAGYNFGHRDTTNGTTSNTGNERITGTRIYWASNEDGFSNLYLLFDCDFEKGSIGMGRAGNDGSSGRIPWKISTSDGARSGTMKMDTTSGSFVEHPPKFETYESLNGYKHDDKLDAKWKTSVIANGRAYIGNIKRKQKSTFNCSPFTDDGCTINHTSGTSDKTITHSSGSKVKPGMIVYGYSGLEEGSYVESVTDLTNFELNQEPDSVPTSYNITDLDVVQHEVTLSDHSGTVADTVKIVFDAGNHGLETGDTIKLVTSPNNDAYDSSVKIVKIDVNEVYFHEADFDSGETDGYTRIATATINSGSGTSNLKTGDVVVIDCTTNNTYDETVTVLRGGLTSSVFKYTTSQAATTDEQGTFKIQLSFDGNGWSFTQADDPEFQDRICKSPVDRLDTFPEENDIELFGSNDGDSIVKLETFADRLFVFKRNSLQILNISNDSEVLEGSYPHLGLDGEKQHQSVLTDHGIAWINSGGVYFYDGKNIEPLSSGKIDNLWKGEYGQTAFWLQHASDIPTIGYDPSSKKLIVSKNISGANSNEDVLIYDFKIKAWVYDEYAFQADKGKTNFVVYKNELIWARERDSEEDIPFEKYTINTPSTQNIEMKTKDLDFGAPAVRKKIYKVYVSYKGDATNVKCTYSVNGDTDTVANFYRTNADGSSTGATDNALCFYQGTVGTDDWVLAELKPVASINNKYSFMLSFTSSSVVAADFEINDITIVYRMKNIK